MNSYRINRIIKRKGSNKNETNIKNYCKIEIIPADGNIYVQKNDNSGLFILRRIIGIIKYQDEAENYITRFVIVICDNKYDSSNNQTTILIVDSFTGIVIEKYSIMVTDDNRLLNIIYKILKVNYKNLFSITEKELSKFFQINKPYLEN